MHFGSQGNFFCYNTTSGHRAIVEARLSSAAISRSKYWILENDLSETILLYILVTSYNIWLIFFLVQIDQVEVISPSGDLGLWELVLCPLGSMADISLVCASCSSLSGLFFKNYPLSITLTLTTLFTIPNPKHNPAPVPDSP